MGLSGAGPADPAGYLPGYVYALVAAGTRSAICFSPLEAMRLGFVGLICNFVTPGALGGDIVRLFSLPGITLTAAPWRWSPWLLTV